MYRHELGNMIFNLEDKKNLKEVKFTKDAVREVLGYLKELYEIKDKEHEEDRRVANLEAQIAEMKNKSFILYSMLYETLEKQGGEDIASQIDQMTGLMLEKQADWFKENRNYDQLKQQLKELEDLNKKLAEYQNDRVGDVIINSGKKIKELQQQLAEHNEFFNAFNCKNFNEFKDFISTFMLTPHEEQTLIRELKQQLEEKDELLRQKIGKMKSTDFIKMCVSCGFMVEAKEIDNQTAIAELEKVKNFLLEKIAEKQSCFDSGNYNDFADGVKTICELILISIDNQIKSLKGDK